MTCPSRLVAYDDPLSGMLARSPLDEQGRGGEILRRPPPAAQPCQVCGVPTDQRYVGALDAQATGPDSGGECLSHGSVSYRLYPSTWQIVHVCDECERRRNRAQAEAMLANPEVYEHIKVLVREYLTGSSVVGSVHELLDGTTGESVAA